MTNSTAQADWDDQHGRRKNMTDPTNTRVEARHERWSNPAAFEDVCEALERWCLQYRGWSLVELRKRADPSTIILFSKSETALAKARGETS